MKLSERIYWRHYAVRQQARAHRRLKHILDNNRLNVLLLTAKPGSIRAKRLGKRLR